MPGEREKNEESPATKAKEKKEGIRIRRRSMTLTMRLQLKTQSRKHSVENREQKKERGDHDCLIEVQLFSSPVVSSSSSLASRLHDAEADPSYRPRRRSEV